MIGWDVLAMQAAAAGVALTALLTPYCGNEDRFPYNGYRWIDGTCVPGHLAVESWYRPQPEYAYGGAVFYGPTVMESTAAWRGLSLNGYLDGVALMSPADIGRTVWLHRPGHRWEGPFLVVDTAARHDMWPVIMVRDEIIEIGFKTAVRWGMASPTGGGRYDVHLWRIEGVEVFKSDEPPDWLYRSNRGDPNMFRMMPEPVEYRFWFASHAILLTREEDDYWVVPRFLRPDRWLWVDRETVLGPYDDWYGFLDGILTGSAGEREFRGR